MLLGAKHVFGRVVVEVVYLVSVCRMLTIETRRPEVTLSKFLGKCIRPLFLRGGTLHQTIRVSVRCLAGVKIVKGL